MNATPRSQFGLAAIFGCFTALAMALAYLRQFDSAAVFLNGFIALGFAFVLGQLVGWPTGRRGETSFWSAIIASAGYLSVVGETRYGVGFHAAWSLVGAASGAAAAAMPAGRPIARMLASCLGGAAAMLISYVFFQPQFKLAFDLVAAAVVGLLVGALVEIIMWVEARSQMPRYVTASWLLCAVIVGNLLVPLVLLT